MKSIIKFVPNLITITRIIMSFLFVYTIGEEVIFSQERSMSLFIIFLAGIYSSYLRIRSCIVFYRLENNGCI
jgi:CDP-diacylglycerol--glycerol-3-phosphate 3-phosphatidyltransferase